MNINAIFAGIQRTLRRLMPLKKRTADSRRDGSQSIVVSLPSPASNPSMSATDALSKLSETHPAVKHVVDRCKTKGDVLTIVQGDQHQSELAPTAETSSKQRGFSAQRAKKLANRELQEIKCCHCGNILFYDGVLPENWTRLHGTDRYTCSIECAGRSSDILRHAVCRGAKVSIEGEYIEPKFETKWCRCGKPFTGEGDECGDCLEN